MIFLFIHTLISADGGAESDFLFAGNPLNVFPVLNEHDGGADAQNHHQNKIVGGNAHIYRNYHNGAQSAHGNKIRDQGCQHDHGNDDQCQLPAQGKGHAEIGGQTFATPEAQIKGENMAQNTGNASHSSGIFHTREQALCQPDRQKCFANVMQRHQYTAVPAEKNRCVGGTQVAAACAADIQFFDFADVIGHVGAAQQIAKKNGQKVLHTVTAFCFLQYTTFGLVWEEKISAVVKKEQTGL